MNISNTPLERVLFLLCLGRLFADCVHINAPICQPPTQQSNQAASKAPSQAAQLNHL
jgi:hypothetical protein